MNRGILLLSIFLGSPLSALSQNSTAVPSLLAFAYCAANKSQKLNRIEVQREEGGLSIARQYLKPEITAGLQSSYGSILAKEKSSTGDYFLKYSQQLLNFVSYDLVDKKEYDLKSAQSLVESTSTTNVMEAMLTLQKWIENGIRIGIENDRMKIQEKSISYLQEAKRLQLSDAADLYFAEAQLEKTKSTIAKIEANNRVLARKLQILSDWTEKKLTQIFGTQVLPTISTESPLNLLTEKDLSEHPLMKFYTNRSKSFAAELGGLKSEGLPKLSLDLTYSKHAYGYQEDLFERPDTLTALATLSISLSDQLIENPKRALAAREIASNEETRRRKLSELLAEANELVEEIKLNQSIKASVDKQLEMIQKSYDLSEKKFSFGKMSYQSLREIESELINIQLEKKLTVISTYYSTEQLKIYRGLKLPTVNLQSCSE